MKCDAYCGRRWCVAVGTSIGIELAVVVRMMEVKGGREGIGSDGCVGVFVLDGGGVSIRTG